MDSSSQPMLMCFSTLLRCTRATTTLSAQLQVSCSRKSCTAQRLVIHICSSQVTSAFLSSTYSRVPLFERATKGFSVRTLCLTVCCGGAYNRHAAVDQREEMAACERVGGVGHRQRVACRLRAELQGVCAVGCCCVWCWSWSRCVG